MFKSAAVAQLASLLPNPTEMLTLSGVLMTLELAEDFERSFEDVFNEERSLFGKLKRVYDNESLEVLETSVDLYSPWFGVNEAIAKYDDQEKEDEWRMRIG